MFYTCNNSLALVSHVYHLPENLYFFRRMTSNQLILHTHTKNSYYKLLDHQQHMFLSRYVTTSRNYTEMKLTNVVFFITGEYIRITEIHR